MENILNKIIELDRQAKQKVSQAKEKEENIESYISKKIEEEKQAIDSKYLNKKASFSTSLYAFLKKINTA